MRFKLKKRHKRLLASLLITLLLAAGGYAVTDDGILRKLPGPTPPGTYSVVQFEDGDTITVAMNGNEERVRMIGVDTPETKDPRKPVQCFGHAASRFTKDLIGDQPVRLELD